MAEFYVGGEEEGIVGRSLDGKKKPVIVALVIVSGPEDWVELMPRS